MDAPHVELDPALLISTGPTYPALETRLMMKDVPTVPLAILESTYLQVFFAVVWDLWIQHQGHASHAE